MFITAMSEYARVRIVAAARSDHFFLPRPVVRMTSFAPDKTPFGTGRREHTAANGARVRVNRLRIWCQTNSLTRADSRRWRGNIIIDFVHFIGQ